MSALVEVNQAQIESVRSLLNGIEKDAVLALRRSLNKTATAAKTLSAKEIGGTITLKSAKIKEYITIKKAAGNELTAVLSLKTALMPAILFTNRKLAKGVSLKLWKAEPTVKLRHYFYATMNSGHIGIFSREEIAPGVYAGRLPVGELLGPSITTVYEKTPGLAVRVETESAERLLREMDSQVNFILSNHNG